MSRPWCIVLIVLILTFVVNVGFTYLTMIFPQMWPPLPGG
jgi:hypothetical protein